MISKNDVQPGDMLLYVLNEKPQFLPLKKDNTWANFHVLVDRLIITMSGSQCTHSALAATEKDTAVEATVPYCQYRKGMYVDGYQVLVRRVATKGKGAAVLNFLPPGINPNTNSDPKENLPYAYAQSIIASLLCLFRRETSLDPLAREATLVFLQLILHPLAEAIDNFIAKKQNKESAWFCSQLVAHCYDQAAKQDPAYKLHFPALDKPKKTLFEWLIAQVPSESIKSITSTITTRKKHSISQIEAPEISYAGISLLTVLENNTNDFTNNDYLALTSESPVMLEAIKDSKNHSKAAQIILSDTFRLLSLLGINNLQKVNFANWDIYKESLIMPCDLEHETALQHIGVLHDHS